MSPRREIVLTLLAAALGCSDSQGPGDQPQVRYTSITAGNGFTCGLSEAGDTYCWGGGPVELDSIPVRLTTPEPLLAISAANGMFGNGMCAASVSHRVYCFGGYTYGNDEERRFGDGMSAFEITGVALRSVVFGRGHGCGLAADSTAWCWGSYISGKRGVIRPMPGPLADMIPSHVDSTLKFVALTAGTTTTCGILADRQLACWGDSLVTGNPGAKYVHLHDTCWLAAACAITPVLVDGLTGATSINAGHEHTCAIGSQGVRCWGANYSGQLGSEVGQFSSATVTVPLTEPVTEVVAGGTLSCGLTSLGTATCWGGYEFFEPRPSWNIGVKGVRFTALAAGFQHACGLGDNGAVYCWGTRGYELGGGSGKPSLDTPIRVAEPRS